MRHRKGMAEGVRAEPRVLIEPASCHPGPAAGEWLITWRVHNAGEQPLQFLSARLPHDHFRSQEQQLASMPTLRPGKSTLLELPVAAHEPPGSEVENAFLILRVVWGDQPWRIFARLRIHFDRTGSPVQTIEAVTLSPTRIVKR